MSKISIFISLFLTLLAIDSSPVQAQNRSIRENQNQEFAYLISPRQLISLASQGQFKAQGIASHDRFRHGVKTGKITAQILIDGAIASKRLPAKIKSDRNYLQTVKSHLKSGGCSS